MDLENMNRLRPKTVCNFYIVSGYFLNLFPQNFDFNLKWRKIVNTARCFMKLTLLLLSFMLLTLSTTGWAASGSKGNTSFGVMGGFVNSEQTHLNTLRVRANQRAGGISASDLDRAMNLALHSMEAGMLAFQLRPSYFMQEEGSGAYEYSTTGYTVEPTLSSTPWKTRT